MTGSASQKNKGWMRLAGSFVVDLCGFVPSCVRMGFAMKRLRVYVLGGFRATVDETPITAFEADTARALLAYLVLNTAYPHRREHLAHLLWGDQPRESGLVNLRAALARLRQALSDKDTDSPF